MAQKPYTISQILTTVHHDGRFAEMDGRATLESMISDRVWRMDGVEYSDSVFVGTTGQHFVTLPEGRYAELLAMEEKLNNQAGTANV